LDGSAGLANVDLDAMVYSTDSIINSVFVISVDDPASGKKHFVVRTRSFFPRIMHQISGTKSLLPFLLNRVWFLEPTYKISIYLWNRGKSKVYLDDLSIIIH